MLELVRRFVKQPLPAYRNMQIVFNLLALQFLIPSMTYFFAPEQALGPLRQLAQTMPPMRGLVLFEALALVQRAQAAHENIAIEYLPPQVLRLEVLAA